MEKWVFSSKRSNSLRGTCTVCWALMSSITGNSAAGSVDRLKRLRPALITTFSPSTARDTDSFSGSARRMSKNLRPGTVMSPASCTATSVEATNSTSKIRGGNR